MILVIDIGNTRTKWALADAEGKLTEYEVCMNADLAETNLKKISKKADMALISNVAGDAMAERLEEVLAPLPSVFAATEKQACGVLNSVYPTLGVDRWMALIAVKSRVKQAVLVVNAGTAITIDALDSQGKFLGGTIMPGIRLMHTALADHTAQLNVHGGAVTAFPNNTQDALESGCLNAAVGAVMVMLKRLERHSGWLPRLVVSGGDAQLIADALKPDLKQVMIMDNLVLQGLALLAKEKR